jgi:ATP-dependent DNA ligase
VPPSPNSRVAYRGVNVQQQPRGRGLEDNVCRVAPFLFSQYIARMLSRVRNSRGRPLNAPAAFIHPCRPTVTAQPPSGPGWAHELKHDRYRLQIHVRDGRVKLYTMNGADWSKHL